MYMHMQIKQYMLTSWGELMNLFDLFKLLQAYNIIVKQQSTNNHFHRRKMS